jgi:hypothetical protein
MGSEDRNLSFRVAPSHYECSNEFGNSLRGVNSVRGVRRPQTAHPVSINCEGCTAMELFVDIRCNVLSELGQGGNAEPFSRFASDFR